MGQPAYDMSSEVRRRKAPQTQRKVALRVEKGGKRRLSPFQAAMQHALQLISMALLAGFAVSLLWSEAQLVEVNDQIQKAKAELVSEQSQYTYYNSVLNSKTNFTSVEEVAGRLETMRRAGVKLTIVSNGAEKRVRPFAEKLGLAYLYRAAKPLPFALMVAQHRMGVKHRQMAMVGDQLYADRMVAALYGIPGLMVIPRGPDLGAQVILKRKWEKKHWQKYYVRGGKTL